MRRPGLKGRDLQITAPDTEWLARLKEVAAEHGLATSSFVVAVVEGAIRKGITHSLVEVGGANIPRLRSAGHPARWTQVGRGHLQYGGFVLQTQGRSGTNMVPGQDGWFLSGPDLPSKWVGLNRGEAVPVADAVVDRKLAELHDRLEAGDPTAEAALEALTAPEGS